MLEKATISGYRSCHDTEVPLGSAMVALLGRNGVGKSNILRALHWLSHAIASASPSPAPQTVVGRGNYEIQLGIGEYRYSYTLRMGATRDSAIYERLVATNAANSQDIFIRNGSELMVPLWSSSPLRARPSSFALPILLAFATQDDQVFSHATRVYDYLRSVRYYPLAHRYQGSGYVRASTYGEWREGYEATGRTTDSVLNRLIYMYNQDRARFVELSELLGPDGLDLIEHIDVLTLENRVLAEPRADATAQAEPVYAVVFQPASHQAGASRGFFLNDLSSGTERVLEILVCLLFDRSTLMLVEQPEDSVHFRLLDKLIDVLRQYADAAQIVFSTHSREVLNVLSPEEIRLVHSDHGLTRVSRLDANQISAASRFLAEDGALSEYLELFE